MDGIIGRSLVGNKLKRICLQNHVAESLRTMRNKPPSQHASASATKADDTVGSHFAEAPVKDPCMHHTSAVQRLLVPSCLLIGSQPPSQLITTTPSGGFFFERRISQLLSKANKGFVLHHSIATTHGHTQKKQAPHLNAMPLSQRERERGGGWWFGSKNFEWGWSWILSSAPGPELKHRERALDGMASEICFGTREFSYCSFAQFVI
jgi:hypothetical protein